MLLVGGGPPDADLVCTVAIACSFRSLTIDWLPEAWIELYASPGDREFQTVAQGYPARLDNVLRAAHRTPHFLLVSRFDQHANRRRGSVVPVEYADLVVEQVRVVKLGIVGAQGLP